MPGGESKKQKYWNHLLTQYFLSFICIIILTQSVPYVLNIHRVLNLFSNLFTTITAINEKKNIYFTKQKNCAVEFDGCFLLID